MGIFRHIPPEPMVVICVWLSVRVSGLFSLSVPPVSVSALSGPSWQGGHFCQQLVITVTGNKVTSVAASPIHTPMRGNL